MKTIWIIEDDQKIGKLLSDYLSGFGYSVRWIPSLSESAWGSFSKELEKASPSLFIIDVMLPGLDGFEICRRIRNQFRTPVVLLTARGDVMDKVVGLEMGADDYLSKPFEPRELVARIEAVLRRSESKPVQNLVDVGIFRWNRDRMEVSLNGRILELTSSEYDLLTLFLGKPGKVFTRDELMDQLKGEEFESFDRTIDIAVSRIRAKLGDDSKNPKIIKTIRGKGYVLIV